MLIVPTGSKTSAAAPGCLRKLRKTRLEKELITFCIHVEVQIIAFHGSILSKVALLEPMRRLLRGGGEEVTSQGSAGGVCIQYGRTKTGGSGTRRNGPVERPFPAPEAAPVAVGVVARIRDRTRGARVCLALGCRHPGGPYDVDLHAGRSSMDEGDSHARPLHRHHPAGSGRGNVVGTSDLPRRAPVGPGEARCELNALARAQAGDIAKYLGYTKAEQVSAGNTAIWENMDAVFKGANFRNPFQPTKDSARDGTCGLDIGPDGELRGLTWLAQ